VDEKKRKNRLSFSKPREKKRDEVVKKVLLCLLQKKCIIGINRKVRNIFQQNDKNIVISNLKNITFQI
jgi:hypothetical protein